MWWSPHHMTCGRCEFRAAIAPPRPLSTHGQSLYLRSWGVLSNQLPLLCQSQSSTIGSRLVNSSSRLRQISAPGSCTRQSHGLIYNLHKVILRKVIRHNVCLHSMNEMGYHMKDWILNITTGFSVVFYLPIPNSILLEKYGLYRIQNICSGKLMDLLHSQLITCIM